uniref:Uncharacterized protein n=1 Tax=Aegilops tauschii subsp. strangulata TaxID=200361 RepID=A0A453STX2_AEGTS
QGSGAARQGRRRRRRGLHRASRHQRGELPLLDGQLIHCGLGIEVLHYYYRFSMKQASCRLMQLHSLVNSDQRLFFYLFNNLKSSASRLN